MSLMPDELYRFTVVRRQSPEAVENAVTVAEPDPDVLAPMGPNDEWSIARCPNAKLITGLIDAHRYTPPSGAELRNVARAVDAPTDAEQWSSIAATIVNQRTFGDSLAGVSALIEIALNNRPRSDATMVTLTDAAALLDTLQRLSREVLLDSPDEARWTALVSRVVTRPNLDRRSADGVSHNGALDELRDIAHTVGVVDRMVAAGEARDRDIEQSPIGNLVRARLRAIGDTTRALISARDDLLIRARHVAESAGLITRESRDTRWQPLSGHQVMINVQPPDGSPPYQAGQIETLLADSLSEIGNTLFDPAAEFARRNRRVPSRIQPVGRQDLLVVRTRHIGYRLADISYIENVAASEARSRTHELEREDESLIESESVVETSNVSDLTTTTRDELREQVQNEKERSIALEGRVRATYRGPVEVEAEASASFQQRNSQSSDVVRDHAVTVVEKAVNSVRERTQERALNKVRTLVKERNTHEFLGDENNKSMIYQWIKRVDRAAIYNYGERLMYDFIVPVPASNLRQQSSEAPTEQTGTRPPPTDVYDDLMDKLAQEGVEAVDDFLEDGRISSAFDIGDPPSRPEAQWITVELSQVGQNPTETGRNWFVTAKELIVPHSTHGRKLRIGYHTFSEGDEYLSRISIVAGNVQLWARHDTLDRSQYDEQTQPQLEDRPQLEVRTGHLPESYVAQLPIVGDSSHPSPGAITVDLSTDNEDIEAFEPGSHTVSVLIDDFSAFGASVGLLCEPTPDALNAWRNAVLASVVSDYWRQYEAHTQQLLRSQPDTSLLEDLSDAQSAELREIEDAEIKHAAIGILRGKDPVGEPVEKENGNSRWYRDNQALAEEILFVEQAFEWDHMQFTLYPYYWSKKELWASQLFGVRGGDRQFREFLKAGAARVQLAVRPGFEQDVEAYINDGVVWSGQGRPRIGSTQYVDFIAEKRAELGAPGDEKPALGPDGLPVFWDFTTPTDLVILRSWEGDDGQAPFSRYIPPAAVDAAGDPLEGWGFGTGAVPDNPSQ